MHFLIIAAIIIGGAIYYVRSRKRREGGQEIVRHDEAEDAAAPSDAPGFQRESGPQARRDGAGGDRTSAFPVFSSMEELDAFYERESKRLSGEREK
ncbi:MAG: hypothetical protein LBS32_07730 [Clostridiales Family XIII bacterium]|nr:hypothetical protein [Clostridiales Family XIII bacterium]